MVSPPYLFWTESSNASVRVSFVTPILIGFACCLLMKHRGRATFALFRRCRQSIAENRLGFLQDAAQMIRSSEALYIDLVDILGLEWI
jgi:hypothetical protein